MNLMIFIKKEEIHEIASLYDLNKKEKILLKNMVNNCSIVEKNNGHEVSFLFENISIFAQKKLTFAFGELFQRATKRKRGVNNINFN